MQRKLAQALWKSHRQTSTIIAYGGTLESQLFCPIFSRMYVRNCGFFARISAPLYLVSISQQSHSVYLVSIMQQSQSAYLVSIAQQSYCISRVNYAASISRVIDFVPILFFFCSNFVPILFYFVLFCSILCHFLLFLCQFCCNLVPISFQRRFKSDFLAFLTACWFEKAV